MSKKLYPTPHINAEPKDFAETLLMPGDPFRARFIAQKYLHNPIMINNVRGICGFTGKYKGKKVSVMASGMGIPSIGIYSHELYNIFGVENIIRVGTAGSLNKDVNVRDIVIAMSACTDSNYAAQYNLNGTFAPTADYKLLKKAVKRAKKVGANYHIGSCLSSDFYYNDNPTASLEWAKMGVLCVEMETAALYMNAARSGKNALGIFTISDSLITGEETSADERQSSFIQMMEIALETAIRL